MVYRFGNFRVDESTRQLLSSEVELHLSPKAFELLRTLILHRPRAVSKTELQERLWPATFVQETNIAGLVAELRRALGDPPSNSQFVRTVHRFGYRFVADVAVDQETPRPGAARPPSPHLVFEQRHILLMEGVNVIGRTPDATVQIDSPGVSRSHASILVHDGEATLEDLGSKNGTHLNDTGIVAPCPLADGDEIRLGAIRLTFRIAPPGSPTETVTSESAPDRAGRSRTQ